MARHAVTPEQDLCFAVVRQAVEDLESSDEEACFEAHEFLFQKRGGWADMRRMYFSLIGLDEDSVQEHLAPHYDPPERPDKKWTMMEVYDVLPKGTFKPMDIVPRTTLRYASMMGRFQHLMSMGLIRRVDRGTFVRTDRYDAWVATVVAEVEPDVEVEPAPMQLSQSQLLDILRDGPKTMRELGFAFSGELGQDALRQRLERAQARNLVTKEGPLWRVSA